MTPAVCPPAPDCPLYAQRLTYAADEPLRRAVLSELHRHRSSLASLIRAEAVANASSTPALPEPQLEPLPSLKPQKGATP